MEKAKELLTLSAKYSETNPLRIAVLSRIADPGSEPRVEASLLLQLLADDKAECLA